MIAIIPARKGSEGVPGKNKRLFCGRPLIEWTVEAALKSGSITTIVVSSDDKDILDNQYLNESVDIMLSRPKRFSGSLSPAVEYINHVFDNVVEVQSSDYFCILQPTSPLRRADDIDNLYKKVVCNNSYSGVTVVDVPHNFSPEALMVEASGKAELLTELKKQVTNRTFKKRYLARNGAAVYICNRNYFRKEQTLFCNPMEFLKMPMMSSIDIDCEEEFQLAELIMRERLR